MQRHRWRNALLVQDQTMKEKALSATAVPNRNAFIDCAV
jgi:hypothetical protein